MKRLFLIISCLSVSFLTSAQIDSFPVSAKRQTFIDAEIGGLIASGSRTPFWLQANQFGLVPKSSPAGTVRVGISERFGMSSIHPNRSISYGIQAVGNAARTSTVLLPQAYLSLDLGRFSLWGGRRKEVIGLGDSTLTSGFYSWSGNALPITKIQVGTNGFTPLGFTNGFVSIHTFFAHGWFANTDSVQGSYLHQKAFYIRIGRPNSRVRLTGGVVHNAQWGGRSGYLPPSRAKDGKMPSSFKDYLYVLTASEGSDSNSQELSDFDRVNRVGNHLGSIDFSLETTIGKWEVMGYHQHPFEDKSGVVFINFPDGLYGLRLLRRPAEAGGFQLRHILLEYFNTMSQSGAYVNTGTRYEGQDDYFNNYQYIDGWVQNRRVIGSPFIAYRSDLRPERQNEHPEKRIWAIASNRVQMGHVGFAGTIGRGVQWQTRLSISQHYGTHRHPFVQPVAQFSGAAWLTWPLGWLGGSELKTAIALDQGQLYENTLGGWISVRKVFKTVK